MSATTTRDFAEAARQLGEAAGAKKCWQCGCLHSSLRAIEKSCPQSARPEALASAVELARSRLRDVKYDCLGCDVCWPALASNALGVEEDACPSEPAEVREGWPPLPGSYQVLRYHASVAVCTLTDESLTRAVVPATGTEIGIVGTLQTENLGIERLVQNTLANINLRFLVLCGADSRRAIGHLPGQSLMALSRSGVDEQRRIIGAPGRRPVLRNISREAVEHFRRTIEIVDLIGETRLPRILDTARDCALRHPGPAEPFAETRSVDSIKGYLPQRMISDPAGYFVVFPDTVRRCLMLEHYRNDGVLDSVIEGRNATELYIPAIEKGLVSRLDHAAYLGRELARAEHSLRTGETYVQDAAPERSSPPPIMRIKSPRSAACCCGPDCKETSL